jgi:hypothetical protein
MRTKQHRFDVLGGNPADALHKICSLRLRMSGWSPGKMCSQQAVGTVRCPPLVRTLCTALVLGTDTSDRLRRPVPVASERWDPSTTAVILRPAAESVMPPESSCQGPDADSNHQLARNGQVLASSLRFSALRLFRGEDEGSTRSSSFRPCVCKALVKGQVVHW